MSSFQRRKNVIVILMSNLRLPKVMFVLSEDPMSQCWGDLIMDYVLVQVYFYFWTALLLQLTSYSKNTQKLISGGWM